MPETNIAEPVGKVIVLSGSATAESSSGERLLKIGDPVFKNDIIKTDVGSKVQIKFADNTQVSQDESSTLSIDKFVYNPDPADNSDLLLNMMKGTFRTITGEITKDSPTSFMLKSPQSTIGIRGTIILSEVHSLYEKHGVEELTPGKIVVFEDSFGNLVTIKVPMKILEFFKGKPVSEVRDLLLKELEDFREKAPLDTEEKDIPLGYTPSDEFVAGLDQSVDILGADVIPSDFGLTGNMVLLSIGEPGLLGVFDTLEDIPGYTPDSGPGDTNENVIPGVNQFTVSENQVDQAETDTENSTYTFTVTRTGDTENSASIDWIVAGSGANPADADDFVWEGTSPLPSGQLIIPANETTGTITITVAGDTDFELNESFSLILSYPEGSGTATITSGNVTILNDDSPHIQLAELDGTDGFRVEGVDSNDYSGWSVSNAGDVNGDGFDDFIIGAYGVDSAAGASYLVFGGENGIRDWENPELALDLGDLDGSNGFKIEGISDSDFNGRSVSAAGDVNGDGYADLLIGAHGARTDAGESYVVLGGPTGVNNWTEPQPELYLNELGYLEGFSIVGIDGGDNSGLSVSNAGDVNGDGFDDLIIGAYGADLDGGEVPNAGESYLVFGGPNGFEGRGRESSLDLNDLNGSNGIRIYGIDENDQSGWSVSNAGDINSDGYDDFLIGAYLSYGSTVAPVGESYLIFGDENGIRGLDGDSFSLGSLNGENGIRINGVSNSLSNAGDVNGDGFDDFILGSYDASPNGNLNAGESYLIFGGENGIRGWVEAEDSFNISSLDGYNGFSITGIDPRDYSGISVSSAGDTNGDGYDDLIIGAYMADPDGNSLAGESYLVFGGEFGVNGWDTSGSTLDLGELNGLNGFQIYGDDRLDYSGSSVSSAGDINGDGFDDLIIGAFRADPGGDSSAGESYILYGGDFTYSVDVLGTESEGSELLIGTTGADNIVGGLGNDNILGLGGSDVVYGGAGNDLINVSDFFRIDGGSGFDTLQIDEMNLNLSIMPSSDNVMGANSKIQGIERIDLGYDDSENHLTLSMSDVLDMSDTTNILVIDGDSNDLLTFSDSGWEESELEISDFAGGVHPEFEDFAPESYDVYTNSQATLFVNTDLTNVTFTEALG